MWKVTHCVDTWCWLRQWQWVLGRGGRRGLARHNYTECQDAGLSVLCTTTSTSPALGHPLCWHSPRHNQTQFIVVFSGGRRTFRIIINKYLFTRRCLRCEGSRWSFYLMKDNFVVKDWWGRRAVSKKIKMPLCLRQYVSIVQVTSSNAKLNIQMLQQMSKSKT